jgi:transcriptional regulator with XRE-family HTH domain
MPGSRDFGKIINERRLALGYSLGQLANRMGTTATKVRSWERGDATPDRATIDQLAEELNMSVGVLRATLPAAEPALDDGGEERTAAVAGPVFSDAADTAASEVEDQDEDHGRPEELSEEAERASTEEDVSGDPEPTALVVATDSADVEAASSDSDLDDDDAPEEEVNLIDLPTEAVPVVPSMPPFEPSGGGLVPAAAAVATVPARVRIDPNELPIAEPSGLFAPVERLMVKVFDPEKTYLFWIRIALIAVIFFVFLRVLAWAVPEFFDTLRDILDTIESTPTEPDPGTSFIQG